MFRSLIPILCAKFLFVLPALLFITHNISITNIITSSRYAENKAI